MHVLTLAEINECCNTIVSRVNARAPWAFSYFNVLQLTGCRVEESTRFSLWTMNYPYEIKFQTLKRGGIRYVNGDVVAGQYLDYYNKSIERGFFYSTHNIRRIYEQFTPLPNLMVKSKQISVHLFRHCFIKNMYSEGYPIEYIAEVLGYSDSETARYYVESIIYNQ